MGSAVPWRQTSFPSVSSIVSQHESVIVLGPMRGLSILESNVWGMLFYCAQVEKEHNEGWGIHRSQFVGDILLFVRHAGGMLTAMGYSGPIVISTTLGPMLQVQWFYDAVGWLEPRTGSELDDTVSFSLATTSETLVEKPDGIAMDLLRHVLYSVNAPDLVEDPEKFAALIRQGYSYNCWPQPQSLRT